jgi:hypothetical protein
MSRLRIEKWEGLGNDFIVLDAREAGQRAAGWSAPRVGDFHALDRFGRVVFVDPSAPTAAAAPAPEAAPARTLRGVKFVVEGASAVSARCGGVNGSGTTSAYLRDIPAGACTLTATVRPGCA